MEADLLLPTYERQPILFERGRGVYLWDADDKRYLDFLSGIGVNALGHNHPAVAAVIRRQAGRLIHISNLFFHEYQAQLARLLGEASGLDRAFFCNSGTEAWEGALKFARAFAQAGGRTNGNGGGKNGNRPASHAHARTRILAMDNSFHGRTFGALATTGQPKYRAPFVPLVPGVTFVKFNDCDDLNAKFDARVCALCIETIQGEGGICPVRPEFLALARRLTKQSGALLVLDEIQCGLGRTGRHFAYQHYDVLPDIVTVAKPLACGLPLGAILTTERVAGCIHPGMHGTTFGGGPLACAVAIEFLRQEKKLLKHVSALGEYFQAALQALDGKHRAILEVRGVGLMQAIELDSSHLAKAVAKQLLEEGIIINRTHETVLRFLPPYVIQRKHVDQVVKALDRALRKHEESRHKTETEASPPPREAHAHA
jgi:acetylornithine aminotransferase/acetylornithine/N-succinyldiaminopimelate aminotransferase